MWCSSEKKQLISKWTWTHLWGCGGRAKGWAVEGNSWSMSKKEGAGEAEGVFLASSSPRRALCQGVGGGPCRGWPWLPAPQQPELPKHNLMCSECRTVLSALLDAPNKYRYLPNCLYKRQFLVVDMDSCHTTITESTLNNVLFWSHLTWKSRMDPDYKEWKKFCVVFKNRKLPLLVNFLKNLLVGQKVELIVFFLSKITSKRKISRSSPHLHLY